MSASMDRLERLIALNNNDEASVVGSRRASFSSIADTSEHAQRSSIRSSKDKYEISRSLSEDDGFFSDKNPSEGGDGEDEPVPEMVVDDEPLKVQKRRGAFWVRRSKQLQVHPTATPIDETAMIKLQGEHLLGESCRRLLKEHGDNSKRKRSCSMQLRANSNERNSWDVVLACAILWEAVATPFALSFQDQGWNDHGFRACERAVYVVFVADIFVNFRTTYYLGEREIRDSKLIARHYVTSRWFPLDLITTLPGEQIAKALASEDFTTYREGGRAATLLKVVRLLRVVRGGGKLFRRSAEQHAYGSVVLRLSQLLAFIALNLHWSACCFYAAVSPSFAREYRLDVPASVPTACETVCGGRASTSDCVRCVEIYSNNVVVEWRHVGLATRYLKVVYIAASFILGLGAVNPLSNVETVLAVCMSIYGACLQATVFGAVAVLLSSLDAEVTEHRQKVMNVASRMRRMHLPKSLRDRVCHYFHMMWKLEQMTGISLAGATNALQETPLHDDDDDGGGGGGGGGGTTKLVLEEEKKAAFSARTERTSFLDELSPNLRTEVKMHLFSEMLKQNPIFVLCQPDLIEELVLCLFTTVYLPGDRVLKAGEVNAWMGFLGTNGRLAVLQRKKSKDEGSSEGGGGGGGGNTTLLYILYEGDLVGELGMLFHVRRATAVEAVVCVRLHVLNRAAYVALKARFKTDCRLLEREIEATMIKRGRVSATDYEQILAYKAKQRIAERTKAAAAARSSSSSSKAIMKPRVDAIIASMGCSSPEVDSARAAGTDRLPKIVL
ncbi:hypothetical protein CTAYLR_008904 [Chrysophaeum taylorii]|uniref:Cyclic nucleotide-binding domain-containing protein n=1 Tax=Chrysophaeum taylorii TaxID=2483200 RepID=A0AAD7XMY5_9STRA|nr:hypothetical protein CTAYLR_008904 [Chrysophaeum taylorii]